MIPNWDDLSDTPPPGARVSAPNWDDLSDTPPRGKTNDVKTALIQGIKEVPGAITGLADIPAGLVGLNRPFSRAADAVGEFTGFQPSKSAKADEAKYSDAYKKQKAEIDAIEKDPDKGFMDMAKFYAENPGYTGKNIVRSVPSMLLGGVYGRGLKALGGSAVARGAAGEGAVMAGQQMESIDPKVDPARAAIASLGTGVIGAGIGAAGGRIANRAGIGDVDTMLAGGGRGTGPVDLLKRGILGRAGIGVAQEGAEELGQSLTEQGAKNLAEDKPLTQGMMRAGMEGTLAGGTLGGAMGAASRGRPREVAPNANPTQREEPADEAATAAQDAMATAETTPQQPPQDTPAPVVGNPLIEQQQAEQEKLIQEHIAETRRDELMAKVGGIIPLDGGQSMFNGETFNNEDTSGKLEKKIAKFIAEDQKKPQTRRNFEQAYVDAYNSMNKTALANGEIKPLKYNSISAKSGSLVGDAMDPRDAKTRLSNAINLKISPTGKVSPEVELLQDVYKRFTGQEHPSVARIQELQQQEKEDAKPKSSVVQPTKPDTGSRPVVTPAGQLPNTTTTPSTPVPAGPRPSGVGAKPELITVHRQGKEVQLPRETLAKDLATALSDPKKAAVINDVTGVVDGATMSFRDAAVASLTRQKKPVTENAVENERKRIHKMLASLGITESVVDKVSASDVAPAQIEEISAQPDEGVSIVNSPNASGTDERLTAGQKRVQKEADKILEASKDVKSPEVTTAAEAKVESEIEARRRAEAERNKQRAIARAAASPYADKARKMWDKQQVVLSGSVPEFDKLSLLDMAALVDTYELLVTDELSEADFKDAWIDIANSQEKTNAESGSGHTPAISGLRQDDTGTTGGGEAVRPGISQGSVDNGTSSSESGSTKTKAPVVALKKKRTVEKPGADEFKSAMGDLVDIVSQSGRSNVVPENNPKLMDVLTRLMDAAVSMGYSKLQDAVKFVLDSVKKKFGKRADALVNEKTLTEASKSPKQKGPGVIERNVSKLPPALQGPAFIAATNIKDVIQRGVMGLSFGHDLADMVSKTLPSAKKFFDAMDRKEAVKNRLEIEIDKIASEAYKVPDKEALNKFLKSATRSQKWGYQPKWMDTVKIDPVAESQYNKLSRQSQIVADKMFHHGFKSRKEMADTVRAEINAGFDEELKLASEAEKAKIAEKRKSEMHLFDTQFNSFTGPYVPLSRFGDFVMVAKSQARIDAEKKHDTKWLEKEGTKPENYRVEFHDSLGAAKWSAKQLEGTYAHTVGSTKQAYAHGMSEAPWSALRRLKSMVNDHFKDNSEEGKKALQQINQLLKDLYLSNLAETSARKHDLKRRDIEGASDDMLRAFASKGKADAHFMAALMHTGEVQDALTEMRNEAHGSDSNSEGRADRTNAFNEILRRHAGSMDYRPTPIQDKILMLNTFGMLLTKPFYFLQNLTQPFMMSLPVMAGRSGGYFKAANAMLDAYSDMVEGFGKDSAVSGFLGGKFDIDAMPIKPDEKAALRKLMELGILDIGINMDMGYWESRGGLGQGAVDAIHRLTTLVKQVEVINRVTTALASYRLAGGGTKGIEEAKHIVRTTHGNYSTFNAPSLFKKVDNVSKLILQFRKFQLIQLSLMARLTHQSFKGDTKEVRAAARASLTYTLGHYLAMAGVLGMPAMSTIGMVLAAFMGDEEEPKDFEMLVRRAIDNEEIADILLKGAPTLAGMDLSGTLGAGNMTSILPYHDWQLDSKKGYQETAIGLLGPAIGGTAPKIAEGFGMMAKGDFYKAAEKMLPSGVANAMKAYREATEGMTNKHNDMTLSPDEISYWDTLLTALSIRTQTAAKTQFVQGAKIDYENFYKERTAEIKHRYIAAWKEGDGDTMADMREEWQNVQASKQMNGFARQPMSDLVKAPREQMKRERNTSDGVQFQKGSRRFVTEAAGI